MSVGPARPEGGVTPRRLAKASRGGRAIIRARCRRAPAKPDPGLGWRAAAGALAAGHGGSPGSPSSPLPLVDGAPGPDRGPIVALRASWTLAALEDGDREPDGAGGCGQIGEVEWELRCER